MIVWAGIVGALIGWLFADLETYGLVIGGLIGLVVGVGLRHSVRTEVARATRALQDQIDSLTARGPSERGRSAAPAPPVTDVGLSSTARAAADEPTPSPWATPPPSPIGATLRRNPAFATPAGPAEPSVVGAIITPVMTAAKNWLFGGNTIVRVGLIILFVGLSFLARYAASAGLFPIELRLALVVAVGIALLAVGFRTRERRPGFGLALQGGGIATIYLALFAAAKLYALFPIMAAFVLMIVVCALGCTLALLQRSQALAVTAFAGGFAVPLLLAGGGGSIAVVFVYYTILNLAILVIAQRQAWRVLNLLGFFATFGVATLWGTTRYQPTDFVAAQGFLIASVLIYVATAVLYARATPGRLGNMVDTTLLFGPALAGFGLEVGLVHDRPFGSAFAAIGFAALYLGVAAWTMRYRRETFRVMNETMLAIGIGFVTLAVPLALGARWTSAAWALEGAGAFWVGLRQARWMPRLFGILLLLVAALIYLGGLSDTVSAIPLANPGFIGAMLIALAGLATAWWLREPLPHSRSRWANAYARYETTMAAPAFVFGFFFWFLAWFADITRMTPPRAAGLRIAPAFDPGLQPLLMLLAFVGSAWAAQYAGRRWRWPVATRPSYTSLMALVLTFIVTAGQGHHVLQMPDGLLWTAAILLHLRMLYRNDQDQTATELRAVLGVIHVGGVWFATAMLADGLWLAIETARLWNTAWAQVTLLFATVAVLVALTMWAGRTLHTAAAQDDAMGGRRWPLDRHAQAYGWYAAVPIAALVYLGALLTAVISSGNAAPLPYLPLLNPVDLTLGLSLAALELWRRTIVAAVPMPPGSAALRDTGMLAALAGLAFVMVNTVWLRFTHQMLGISWSGDALLDSVVVQTGLAILWTSLALALMVLASRRAQRSLWLVGAGLLALTVIKLLLVDLNAAGGGARIITFIVVGVLMLVVGYLAPLPPKATPIDDRVVA
ncbi:DUF2339 domain-containing protein [Sphingomonas sp. Leaf38]|uniref:DUF2339 domain-containing protein n=1 Tax=Sphingomonas sp. Leaf38 TaxID=1736217 RepID=UPI0006FFC4ED|nr:DUF2339 domain-containing protein [Sphingomonas sp. Leaf38]KQN33529.1 hypothetical protein ASE88_00325 [Sphingomonas sp. Leaf38]